jgi:hypothetical protein
MISAHENKCAMCGKYVFVSAGIDKENEKNQQLQQIDNASCALMFKKFNAVYGSKFADQ